MALYSLEALRLYREECEKNPEAQAIQLAEGPVADIEEDSLVLDDEEEEDFEDIYEHWLDRCEDCHLRSTKTTKEHTPQ